MNNDKEIVAEGAPEKLEWLSTETAMETSARPGRTRMVKVKMRNGVYRVASATYSQSSVHNAANTVREPLYRVALQWLAEYDLRDGPTGKFADRPSGGRPINALEFRVLEMPAPDGKRATAARLGPNGQIAAEPAGLGVMSFLRGILVEWVADLHPDAVVIHSPLPNSENMPEAEIALRDNFFSRSGFTVRSTTEGGHFFAPSIQDLRRTWNTEKVLEIAPSVVAEALCAQMESPLLRKQIDVKETELRNLRRELRSTEVRGRVWVAITILSIVFAIIFGIQPRVA